MRLWRSCSRPGRRVGSSGCSPSSAQPSQTGTRRSWSWSRREKWWRAGSSVLAPTGVSSWVRPPRANAWKWRRCSSSGRRMAWEGCASSDSSPHRSVKGRGLCELRRIPLLRGWVNRATIKRRKGSTAFPVSPGSHLLRPRCLESSVPLMKRGFVPKSSPSSALTSATLPADCPLDRPGASSCVYWESLLRRLGGRRVRIGEQQRDQGYLDRLVDVANDRVRRSHEEKEHDRQRCEGYKGPSRSAPEACQLPDRQLQDHQKPQVTQPVKDEQHDAEVEPHGGDGAERQVQVNDCRGQGEHEDPDPQAEANRRSAPRSHCVSPFSP